MAMINSISYDYYEWLCNFICPKYQIKGMSYKKLLKYLHDVVFFAIIFEDENRAADGIDLRYRFQIENYYSDTEMEPITCHEECSVLEMLVALALRIEEQIMSDSKYGDRTSQWFWSMINNLGLSNMTDDKFDSDIADNVMSIFMNRLYQSDGEGGLFTVHDCAKDLSTVEIWWQACWYMNDYIEANE